MIKPNWDIFKAKFSENPQKNFEWFCYLLFCNEHNKPKGIFRYKNQSAIETEPIYEDNKVIGWQAKFYDDSLSKKKRELIETIEKAKKDYPNLTDLIFYTNQEWGQNRGRKEPIGKTEAEKKAKELGIELEWRVKSFFESEFVSIKNYDISKNFFVIESLEEKSSKNPIIPILFQNLNTKYTTPLTCSRLSEKDILVCPSNKQYIKDITTNLNLANKCIIKGKSGTGKSLLTYQIAKEFYDNGWNIYKIDKNIFFDNTFLPSNKKILLLIDDAQTLSLSSFEAIIENAHENCLVLLNWNSELNENNEFLYSYPCIDIDSKEQVKMIEQYSLKHKKEIIEVLQKMDIRIDYKDYWKNIETRIKKASLEKTPWLFNYTLTEGWRKAENDMKILSLDEHLDLVMMVVAIFQIGTLDKGVEKEIILDELRHYNSEERWINKASNVIDEYCIKDDVLIRHKHYLYAKEVLGYLNCIDYKDTIHHDIVDFIKRFLTYSEYQYGYSSLLEYIMFYYEYVFNVLKKDNYLVDITKNIFEHSTTTDAIKIKNLNSLIRFNKKTLSVVSDNIEILNNWILLSNSDTVLELKELINTLHNEEFDAFQFTEEMLEQVLSKIDDLNIINSARFSSLYDRLHLLSTTKQREKCMENISRISINFNIPNRNLEIDAYHFTQIINNFSHINHDWSRQCIDNNIELIADAFNTDILKALDLYNDLLIRYFGVIYKILDIKEKSTNKRLAKKFINLIKTESIVKAFEVLTRFQMQNFAVFLMFIFMNDENKLKDISNKIDYKYLKKIYQDDVDIEHWHKVILRLLYNPENKLYQEYIEYLIKKNEYLEELLVVLNPSLSEQELKNGKKYKMKFHASKGYRFSLILLKAFDKDDNKELSLKIIYDNKQVIEETIFNNISNVDRSNDKYEFLVYLYYKTPNLIKELFGDEEKVDNLVKKIYVLLRGHKTEKRIGNLYLFFIKKFSLIHQLEVIRIESKFPSIKRFKI